MDLWLGPERECHCLLCVPPGAGDGRAADPYLQRAAEHVRMHGWSVCGVSDEDDLPGWVYTIGLWHTFGSPEVAMFGLRIHDMHGWVNQIGEQIRQGRALRLEEPRDGVIDGFSVVIRPVHESWYPELFGAGMGFYGRPPLPITQVVWPDRHGVLPWEDGCGGRCQVDQPCLWLPSHEQPIGIWRDFDVLTPWPFPGVSQEAKVITTHRILNGDEPIRLVVHNEDDGWEFLDGLPVELDDLAVVYIHHILGDFPGLAAVADLAVGEMAEQRSDGLWERSPVPPEPPDD